MICGKLYEEDIGTLTFIQFNELISFLRTTYLTSQRYPKEYRTTLYSKKSYRVPLIIIFE